MRNLLRPSLVLIALVLLALAACAAPTLAPTATAIPSSAPRSEYWPTADWRTSSPEAEGMDGARLAAMVDEVKSSHLPLHSLIVIHNGYIVSETYFGPYDTTTKHELYSCTKSFVSTLVGIAIDRGAIQNVNRQVLDFFPGETFANTDSYKRDLTLDNVLTMSTGLDWQEGNPAYGALSSSPDWVKFMLDKPLVERPGTRFNYCSGCSHLLSAMVEKATGKNTEDFAKEVLFGPLGITDYRWERGSQGIPNGGWGLWMTPREMAKLGYLFLKGGQWEGRQIVSAQWVAEATRKHTTTDSTLGYGYQWWTYPAFGAYTALGMLGQTIFVAPQQNIVVVTTGQTEGHDAIFGLIDKYVLPAPK